MPTNKENQSWPGWETVKLIGRGSFGAVYEIQRDIFGDIEKAALKVISIPQNESDIEEMYSDGYDEESITSTFQSHLKNIVAEYSLMRKMNGSANIVNCDDVRYVQHDDGIGWDIFIKMELLTPLTKALTAEVPEETVIKIAKDMCAALELCKRYEIVHRDIKPQNIFVSPNGDYKLGDFGIAKTVEKTMGGTKIGTYKYMAPEVYNNQPYGSAADIYSLGLVLYWLLNKKRMPFLPMPPAKLSAGMDEAARNRRLSGEALPPPAEGSEELKRIVLKACAYKTEERFASAAEMLRDLKKISKDDIDEPVQAPEPVTPVVEKTTQTEQEIQQDKTIGVFAQFEKKMEELPSSLPEDGTIGVFVKAPAHNTQTVSEESIAVESPAQEEPAAAEINVPTVVHEPETKEEVIPDVAQSPLEAPLPASQKDTKKYKALLIGAVAVLAILAIVIAWFGMRSGWHEANGEKYYYLHGQKATGLHNIAGVKYYFSDSGEMQTGWLTISDQLHYFNEQGQMQIGWATISGERYYFDADGKMQTGFQQIGNRKYYFNTDGKLHSGWLDLDGKRYYLCDANDGAICIGKWKIGDSYYYFNEDGSMCTDRKELLTETYYFNKDGTFSYCERRIVEMQTNWSKERINLTTSNRVSWDCSYKELSTPITPNRFTIKTEIFNSSRVSNKGIWEALIRSNNEWITVDSFEMVDGMGECTIFLETPIEFDAFTALPLSTDWFGSDSSWTCSISSIYYTDYNFGACRVA